MEGAMAGRHGSRRYESKAIMPLGRPGRNSARSAIPSHNMFPKPLHTNGRVSKNSRDRAVHPK